MFPKFTQMSTPQTRAEFEERLHHIAQVMKDGKMHISSHIADSIGESILAVRLLPNGRIDFLSVDETARLQANTMFQRPSFEDMAQANDESGIVEGEQGPNN
ncbi:hypothetical protein NX722_18235 [Endozoicomonas gorgoniicola]|uniref:Uncharacterized protein n=1 Tax=Endozoicomonas gorgoniicola TaxID=1234144 RepID=A0ABT3MYR8_9GAMM|nr:AVAST type 1 anti-phage system protein Avs1c [Endozoicomonas gorgoniicola]MCW7554526.1 hypothetical protein [Endozoicomonas gorgoniicola]